MKKSNNVVVKLVTILYVALALGMPVFFGTDKVGATSDSTFSGYLTDTNGNPISNARVDLINGPSSNVSGNTDASGHFSILAVPGSYNLLLSGDNIDGMQISWGYSNDTIDLSGDLVQNLQLPTTTIHVTVEDMNGTPIPNTSVAAVGEGLTSYFSGYQADDIVSTPSGSYFTGPDGTVDLPTLVGMTYNVGIYTGLGGRYLCATSMSICLKSPLTISGYTNLVLEQSLPAPVGPTINSPTKTPVLNWQASNGANSYNIYRNGVKIANTSSTTYTDSTYLMDSYYQYYVTAVNSAQESDRGVVAQVYVDNSPPSIIYSTTPASNTNGWNNSNVTISFTCSDFSGISSCSSPLTLNNEGSGQSVDGTAIDNAGNTSTTRITINIDKTPPVVTNPQVSLNKKTGLINVSANATDSLSGVNRGEFYVDTDPGPGNGTSMAFSSGLLSGQINTSSLSRGLHTIYVRSKDVAGNWSAPISAGTIRV